MSIYDGKIFCPFNEKKEKIVNYSEKINSELIFSSNFKKEFYQTFFGLETKAIKSLLCLGEKDDIFFEFLINGKEIVDSTFFDDFTSKLIRTKSNYNDKIETFVNFVIYRFNYQFDKNTLKFIFENENILRDKDYENIFNNAFNKKILDLKGFKDRNKFTEFLLDVLK